MNTNAPWAEDVLAPVLITFNRSAALARTLEAFIAARLTSMKLHVLDNASTDETPQVVASAKQRWPGLTYHRNSCNIGGNANILRAVEVSDSEYSWVIGDDDAWLLQDISELAGVLKEGRADIIRLGWLISDESRGRYLEAEYLAARESMFFASVSMISATIIRRSLIKPHLPHAYMGICDAYPQLVSVMRSIERQSLSTYSVQLDLMTHTASTEPGYYFGDLEWCSSWFRMSRFLDDSGKRRKFVAEVIGYMSKHNPGAFNEFLQLLKIALNYKALGVDQWPYLLAMLAYGNGWKGRVVGLMVAYSLLPMPVARLLRSAYFTMTGRIDKGLRFDRSRL